MLSADHAPPRPAVLREYALLADGERGALVGPYGDIAWMCAPRWHSPSVFASLLGGGGFYQIGPSERAVWGGRYEAESLIWRNRWVTETGIAECRDALAFPADRHRLVLLRRVCAVDGPARIEARLHPRADDDTSGMTDVHAHPGGIWTFRAGALYGRWVSGPGSRHRQGLLARQLVLDAGQQHDFVLELSDRPLPERAPDPDEAWRAIRTAWSQRVRRPANVLAPADTSHGLAVLHGLTSATGGMVAAATTSLPERSEGGRNYDYRYVWLRDQCYAGQAALAVGDEVLLDNATQFVRDRLLEHGSSLAPAYTVDGNAIPDARDLAMPGYPGGAAIAGNPAGRQFQLDVFGEALLLLAGAAGRDRLDRDDWQAADAAAAAIAARWREPDAGIWELDNRHWTHSRLIASAGLRALAKVRSGVARRDHLALADHILADTAAHALGADGEWQRASDDPAPDAALLLPPLRGAVDADDPRTAATLHRYLDQLTDDGYAYRFRQDDRPLPDAEGSFLLCGFLTALALHQQHEPVAARAWFERTRAATGPPVLYSEEYDSAQHQMRGNLPQAFVHAIMIETAARLACDANRA